MHPELLLWGFRNALALAENLEFEEVAFPAISCGEKGFPIAAAASVSHPNLTKSPEIVLDDLL
jgi:O-acetyl-ADP-ribose deacetylase (regulator of RNase III)